MANVKIYIDRIALSLFYFLDTVEHPAGVDREALDDAKEYLAEVFKIDRSSLGDQSNCDSLVDISSSRHVGDNERASDTPASSSQKNAEASQAEQLTDQDRTREPLSPVKDELFGALEKIHYFRRLPDGNIDQNQLDRATNLLYKAVEEMQTAGCQTFDQKSLAETFKSQGNKDMQAKHYPEAIELYTFAISLRDDNAVYYCNRAAAYTKIHWYAEAVQDCLKSIEINPNYSEAYRGLGLAYHAQGKYRDAIDKGFTKALQLDPNNDFMKENIRDAEQKLREEQQRGGPGQFKMAEEKENMMCRRFHLTIFEAKKLPDVRKIFKTRAYAQISIQSANGKTISRRTKADNHNGLNPAWDHAMEFEITASEELYYGVTVVIEVYCERTFGRNGHIGEVRMTMKYLFDEASKKGGNVELSLPIVFTGEENPSDECFLRFSCSFSKPKTPDDKKSNFMKEACRLGGRIMTNLVTEVVADVITDAI